MIFSLVASPYQFIGIESGPNHQYQVAVLLLDKQGSPQFAVTPNVVQQSAAISAVSTLLGSIRWHE